MLRLARLLLLRLLPWLLLRLGLLRLRRALGLLPMLLVLLLRLMLPWLLLRLRFPIRLDRLHGGDLAVRLDGPLAVLASAPALTVATIMPLSTKIRSSSGMLLKRICSTLMRGNFEKSMSAAPSGRKGLVGENSQ